MVALRSQGNWRWDGPLGTGGVVVRWIRKEEGRRLQLEKRVPEGKLCVRPTVEVNRALPAALHPTVVFTHGQ